MDLAMGFQADGVSSYINVLSGLYLAQSEPGLLVVFFKQFLFKIHVSVLLLTSN